jgi:hypothetical protein
MAGDLLKEYLIALGFNIKDEQYRRFLAGIGRSTKEVAGLGETAIATSAAIGYMVEKAARQYEDLYYVSQRTGRSVAVLKAYEFASRQVGVSAEAARGSTEAFYATLRTNPGMQGLLSNLGVNAAGGPADLVGQLKKKFGESGYFVANRFAQMFGIDEQSFRMYWLNTERLAAAQADSLKRQREAGVSAQQNSAEFREYANAINKLEDNFNILTTRIAQDWLPTASKVLPWVDGLIERFNQADKASDGLLGKLTSILGALGGAGIANAMLRKLLGVNIGGGIGATVGKAVAGGGIVGVAVEAATAMKADSQSGNSLRTGLRKLLGIEDPNEPAPWAPGGEFKGTKKALSAIEYFQKQGWSREQASGIAASLNRESNVNPQAVGDNGQAYGIAQWHADRQAAFKEKFGHDIRQSTLEEQLAFVQHELTQGREQFAGAKLRQAKTPEEAGATVSQYYERPADAAGEASRRALTARSLFDAPLAPSPIQAAGAAVTINHDTDINIFGNADKAAQTAITNSQYDIYSQAVRNNLPRTR